MGKHALTSKYDDGQTGRHKALRNYLYRYCKELCIIVLVEHPLLTTYSHYSPSSRVELHITTTFGLSANNIA